jgi:hypothetical protein
VNPCPPLCSRAACRHHRIWPGYVTPFWGAGVLGLCFGGVVPGDRNVGYDVPPWPFACSTGPLLTPRGRCVADVEQATRIRILGWVIGGLGGWGFRR